VEENKVVAQSLTAVIPIRDMSGKLEKVFNTITISSSLNIQNILVVDSSTDGTYEELEEFLNRVKPQNTRLLAGNFGSAGEARNAGLLRVRSNFVTFWDADDEPNPGMYQDAISKVDNVKNAVIVGNFEEIRLDQKPITPKKRMQIGKQPIMFARKPGIWRTIFSYSLIKELKFSSLPMGEDQEFLIQTLLLDPEVIFNNEVFYKYHTGHDGQATSSKAKKRLNYLLYDSTLVRVHQRKHPVPLLVVYMFIFQFFGMLKNSDIGISLRRIPNFARTLVLIGISRVSTKNRRVGRK
jgi:glycosyltransferase involved in cell wall biosynthesis